MRSGTDLIAEERQRQIGELGWTDDHDDSHTEGELAVAASLYCSPFANPLREWPWEPESMNDDWAETRVDEPYEYEEAMENPLTRKLRIRELAKSGALIAAEMDRLQRMP